MRQRTRPSSRNLMAQTRVLIGGVPTLNKPDQEGHRWASSAGRKFFRNVHHYFFEKARRREGAAAGFPQTIRAGFIEIVPANLLCAGSSPSCPSSVKLAVAQASSQMIRQESTVRFAYVRPIRVRPDAALP